MKTSVALCTYNGEKYLKEQIDSILNQTKKVDEIVVCDDRSSDNTIKILEEYSAQNPNLFKIYSNEKNLRSVKNFEKAISLCTGDAIFLSDQDDLWVPEKVEEYVAYFNANPEIKVITSNGYCINDNSEVEDKYAIWDVPQFLKEKNIEFDYYRLITLIGNVATGASMAIKKEIVPNIMPFPVIKDFHHDEWIAMISSYEKQFALLQKKYFYYRIHNNQQVGGVFYDKTPSERKKLTNYFNINNDDTSFTGFKRRIKRLVIAYKRNRKLMHESSIYNSIFEKNCEEILRLFNENNIGMKSKFPIKSSILEISDKLLNKRQLD